MSLSIRGANAEMKEYVLKEDGTVTTIDFSLKHRTLQDIKKILGMTKKTKKR